MADPGSLAACTVARELGIPTVFTLAPDPHGPIAAAERSGTLDRRNFATQDARAALWYRADARGRAGATGPRAGPLPATRPPPSSSRSWWASTWLPARSRHTIVAEGVDTRQADDAVAAPSGRPTRRRCSATCARAIARLPDERQGLPIVVSVGRLHEVKGMARVVEAFALDRHLAAQRQPRHRRRRPRRIRRAAEAAELARIECPSGGHRDLRDRVVLLGHRRHAEASLVLAVARHGWGRGIAPGGAYVCGSLKEEFGLAIVEAMAAGLPVVAPLPGGPATYVEPGRHGRARRHHRRRGHRSGRPRGARPGPGPETAARTREVVDARFTLDRMARTLAAVYRIAAGVSTLALPVEEGRAA